MEIGEDRLYGRRAQQYIARPCRAGRVAFTHVRAHFEMSVVRADANPNCVV